MPRGSRRLSPNEETQRLAQQTGERDPARTIARARESPFDLLAVADREWRAHTSLPPVRYLPEGLRSYLQDDPTLIEASRRAPEGVLRARRHVLSHEESRFFRDYHDFTNLPEGPDGARDMSSNQPPRDLQRRFSREPAPRQPDQRLPPFSSLGANPGASLPPLRALNNRRSASNLSSPAGSSRRLTGTRPPDRNMERRRSGSEQRLSAFGHSSASLEDLEYDLDQQNSQLQALLEFPAPSISSPFSPSTHMRTPQHDQTDDSRRAKRRRLDSERPGSNFKGFRYGKYGQIEPGQLRMEIESCDGGIFGDDDNNPPESILKNDDSVYCTKRDFCNIVLRHQGGTVFTLTELIIRAPGPRFSSPVREGMVFVSMASDEVFTRTAQYKLKYIQSQDSRHSNAERDSNIPIVSVRHNEDGTTTARLRRRGVHYSNIRNEDPLDYRTAVFPADPLPFPHTIATDCSEPEDHQAQSRSRRPRIGTLPFESDSSEDGENTLGWDPIGFDDDDDSPPPHYQRRTQDMTLAEAAEASQLATQEAVQAVGGKLLRPHAKFFIEKGRNRCTIKFDPPVTGRFVLLKMYHPSDNIDIQGLYLKGFAGPRYFPSVQLR